MYKNLKQGGTAHNCEPLLDHEFRGLARAFLVQKNMKGLIWNCKQVKWISKNINSSVEDCLLAYICCEKGDTQKHSSEASRRILQLNRKRYLRNKLVIFPFAHLSNQVLNKNEARQLVEIIANNLANTINVQIMGFNQRKEVNIHLLQENKDVSYFSY